MEDYRRQIDAAADSYAEMTQLNKEQTAELKKTMHAAARDQVSCYIIEKSTAGVIRFTVKQIR